MPLNIDFLQILLHMLNFLLLAGGLTLLLYRPIVKFLEQREAYFAEKEQVLAAQTDEAEQLRREYEAKLQNADADLMALHAEAEHQIAESSKHALTRARAKADEIIATAEREAEERKEHILDAAQTEVSELVITATQKLLSDTVSAERDSALYDEFIRLADEAVADKRTKK